MKATKTVFAIVCFLVFMVVVAQKTRVINFHYSGKEDDVPHYLDSIVPYLSEFENSEDTIFSFRNDTGYYDYLFRTVVGKFIDGRNIYAIDYSSKDTLLNFYYFNNSGWTKIGSELVVPDDILYIDFIDMDNDGRNEVLTTSCPNMNANTFQNVYYCSKTDQYFHHAGSFTTEYKIDKEKQTVETHYGGSWYMPLDRTLYKWYGEYLLVEKQMILELKELTMECQDRMLTYYENPNYSKSFEQDSLKLIYKIPFDEEKHRQLWDNFFQ